MANTCIALPAFFVVYDFFYAPFHRALHHRSVYAYVHKHHHRQVVPTRGNTDAINVHPFEFIMGEYNHVLAIFLVSRYMLQVRGEQLWLHVLNLVERQRRRRATYPYLLTASLLPSQRH